MDLTTESNRVDFDNDSTSFKTTSSENSNSSMRRTKLVSMGAISIDINPPTPEEKSATIAQRPKDLIIPDLIIQTPSPTKERMPIIIFPGSPPPQRASIGETSGLFPNRQQQRRLTLQYEKQGSLDFPFVPPMITITANMSETESDAEFLSPAVSKMPNKPTITGMCYLSPFSICTRGDRAPSEGNLSSSGYSSMASPGPSRCSSNSKLCANETDDVHSGMSISIPRRYQSILKKTDDNDKTTGTKNRVEGLRKCSDSETLSDETLLESNDEGIGTDHLDEKIEDGDIRSAKELEDFIGKELIEHGKCMLGPEEPMAMSQLQLPTIVLSESGLDKLSPVSSRSESPLSERNNGASYMGQFSPQFFGKKDQQLPFTDSDGLYDFPSSDGKGGTSVLTQQRKSTGKRREKRSSKTSEELI